MSQENVDLLKELLARFEAGDRTSWKGHLTEDIIWDTSAAMPAAGIYEGHDGVEQFFVEWLSAWEDPTVEHLELIDAGDSVVNVFRWRGRGRTSGVPTEGVFFAVYDLRDGKVYRYRQYETRTEALEAAGLSE
jgi:ketosteroid isomerase-like protein